jgi:hypothetical protein
VIHLGDNNVPNALTFIDKYNQVGRILQPIVLCIAQLAGHARGEGLCKDRATREYITRTFGGAERLQRMILGDFFRNGFDGSGADNFFDAGSCIDGRLTSAWNWCVGSTSSPSHVLLFRGLQRSGSTLFSLSPALPTTIDDEE